MLRIQRFMAQTVQDMDIVARVVMKLLPEKGPYVLPMDRTNWTFGEERIEIMQQFIRLFGRESIAYLVADREFLGEAWVK